MLCIRKQFDEIRSEPAFRSHHHAKADSQDIVVIGASAGGVEALLTLTAALPADLRAAIFIVVHLPAGRHSLLPNILSRSGPLQAAHPVSGELIQPGRIYVAPPDDHMVIDSGDHVELWRGPKENNCRPSINTLFRSAAVAYGSRVVGVILTGALEDGAAGLYWIKRRQGIAIVQDPAEAQFPQMPQAALSYVAADHVVAAAEVGKLLTVLANGGQQSLITRLPRKE